MAHDFSLTKKSDRTKVVYFFGYYNGVAYKAFDGHKFNNGLSGANSGKFVTKDQAIKGVEFMISQFRKDEHYKREVDSFTDYLTNVILPSDAQEQFAAHYS